MNKKGIIADILLKYVKRAESTVVVFICSDQTKTDIIKGCYVAVLEYESHLPMFTDLPNEYLGKPCQRSFITDPVVLWFW